MSEISGRNRRFSPRPGAAWRLDLAEMTGKGELPLVVEMLAVQDQYRIMVERLADRAHSCSGQRGAGINTRNLPDKKRVQPAGSHRQVNHPPPHRHAPRGWC